MDRELVLDYGYITILHLGSSDERSLIPKAGAGDSLKDRVHARKGTGIAIPLRSYFRSIRLAVSIRPEATVPSSEGFREREAWLGRFTFVHDEIMFDTGVPHENLTTVNLPGGPGRFEVSISWSYDATDVREGEIAELLSICLLRS